MVADGADNSDLSDLALAAPLAPVALPPGRPPPGARISVRRAFLWLLILSLLPLLLLGVGRSVQQLRASEQAVEATLSQRAIETARWQTEVVRTAQAVLTLLAAHPDVRGGGILCDLALEHIDSDFPAFSNVSRIGADGRMACSSVRPLPDVMLSDRPWWPQVQSSDRLVVIGPVFGRISQRQVLVAMLPMRSESGVFDGVVAVSIDMAWMESRLRSGMLGPDAIALVLDGKGRALLSSRQVNLGPVDVGIGTGKVADLEDASGRRWTYAVAPLLNSKIGGQDLYIAYALPEAKLFSASWFQAGFSLLQPLLAVVMVSLVIGFGTNGLVLRWLRELRSLAQAFAEGNYRARLADFDAAPAEFRTLAAAFYKMGHAIERRDHDLQAALDRQKLLVREVHHRVKNNLQIVISLLSLQADRLDTEAGRAALGLTRLRISTLALVHRLFYETGEQATISSTSLLGGVCDMLNQALGKRSDIEVHCDFANSEVELDTAIPLSLWLVEAVANAWAHAFPPGRPGSIMITLHFDGDHGVLQVTDNGVGLPADAADNGPVRGLRILSGVAKQLGGASTITSTPGDGTTLRLRYPVRLRQVA